MSTTSTLKVSQKFKKLSDDSLSTFCTNVSTLIGVSTVYTDPPFTTAEQNIKISQFTTAKAAQPSGGKAATALKNEKRAELIAMFTAIADYVQTACGNNLSTLLLSGFEAASTSRTRSELAKPAIVSIAPGTSGEAVLNLGAVRNAKSYEVRVSLVGADNVPGSYVLLTSATSSRNIRAGGLIPGAQYLFQVRAVGGLTGFSDWSDAVVQRVL